MCVCALYFLCVFAPKCAISHFDTDVFLSNDAYIQKIIFVAYQLFLMEHT